MSNPFDALDDGGPETLSAAQPPSLRDRFVLNFEAGQRYNTILGAIRDASTETNRDERRRFDKRIEAFPEWQGWLEGSTALVGQIVGTAASPENFVPLGVFEKIGVGSKIALSALWARIFSGATDAAIVNGLADTSIQGIENVAGFREGFDPGQWATSTLLGAGIGGVGGAAVHGLDVRSRGRAASELFAAAERERNLFDALDDPLPENPDVVAPAAPEAPAVPGQPLPENPDVTAPREPDTSSAAPAPLPENPEVVPGQSLGEQLAAEAVRARQIETQSRRILDRETPSPGRAPKKPASLSRFLAEIGGVADFQGEMAALGLDSVSVPGAGRLVKDGGRSLDYAREAAAEAGYFDHLYGSPDEAVAKSTVADLLSALDSDNRGKRVYSSADIGAAAAVAAHEEAAAARQVLREKLETLAPHLQSELPDDVVVRAAEHLDDGLDAADALERAIMEDYYGNGAPIPLERPDGSDIPFFDDDGGRSLAQRATPARGGKGSSGDATPARDARADGAQPRDTGGGEAGARGRDAIDEGPFGPIFPTDRFRDDWPGAVETLRRAGDGEIPGLLSHPEIGPIDLVWGRHDEKTGNGYGLAHILAKHPDVVETLPELLQTMRKVDGSRKNRIELDAPDHHATVRVDYDEESKVWLLTAFEKQEQGRRDKGSTGRPASRQEDTSSSSPADRNIAPGGDGDKPLAMMLKEDRTARADRAGATEAGEFLQMAQYAAPGNARARPAAGAGGKAAANIARVRETAEALARDLGVAATRQQRMPHRQNVRGIYKTGSGVVRVRSLEDFDVLTHEYGHHVEKRVPGMTKLMKAHPELKILDYDPVAGRPEEGFAEFFRLWITNRAYARKALPGFSTFVADFEQELAKHPEIRAAIDAAEKAWSNFLAAPSTAAVASTIVSRRAKGNLGKAREAIARHGLADTIHDVLQRAYTFLFDDLNPLAQAVKALQAIHFANTGKSLDLKVADDAYKLARMSRNAYAAGHMDVMYGVAPYRQLNPASASLRDAIVEATGKPNALSRWDDAKVREFGAYLWSRRALGEWERFDRGEIPNPPDKLTRGDHELNVAELDAANPQFASAAAKVHDFALALWQKKRDAGLIGEETYQQGLAIKDYVPGLRDFSADTDFKVPGGFNRQGKAAKGGFARRFRGSKRDVVNPLESLAADAYETAMAIARNDIVKSLDRLARLAGPGGGAIAETIPTKELRATMVDPLQAVENAARSAGLAKPDIVMLRDAVESAIGEEKAAIFRPAMINEKGEPIIFFRDGGELKALRLADGRFGKDLYGALAAMSRHEQNFWLELIAMPARLLRLGITASFDFIGANFVRDQAMAWIFYGQPLKRLGASLRGATDDVIGSEAAKAYSRVHGISGGAQVASLGAAQAERDLRALRRKGWATQRLSSIRGVLQIAELAETGTRIGLFRTFMDEARKRGLSEMEAALEASWRARDYIDFDRRGSGMAALSRITPFLNASIQGLDKSARHMLVPLAKKMLGRPMSAEDGRALGTAVKAWARLAALITASVSLYALQSRHEDHDEISNATRSTHWMIKWGEKWVSVPKPFEFATFINLGEAAYDALVQKDPAAGGRWLDSLFYTLAPPDVLEGNPAVKSYFEVRTNTNFFTNAPIVPESLQGLEPWLQYTSRTSWISKKLGEAFGISPAIADHLIANHLGSWGRNALAMFDWAQPDAPAFGWDDAPIARRFIKDASRGAQSSSMFWRLVSERTGELEAKAKSWRVMMESGDGAGAADYFARLDDDAKAYVATSTMDAATRRLHPLIRARGAVQTIGAIRRDLAMGQLRDGDGNAIEVGSAGRTAADDVLSSLSMAIARNALATAGVPGWAQRREIPEDGFYRELAAISPALAQRLADGYATGKVWRSDAVSAAWPELRRRLLTDGTTAETLDLVADVESQGNPIEGGMKLRRAKRPELTLSE